MARREYKGAATPTTLVVGISNTATTITITDATNWPTGSFSLVVDPGIAGEEKILASSRSGNSITVATRGYDNTTAATHVTGAVIYPVPTAIDFDEANSHVNSTIGVHGLSGAVVGTTDTQTLSAKTLTAPIISSISNTGTLTLPTSTDTLVGRATTDTLTNKVLSNDALLAPFENMNIVPAAATGVLAISVQTSAFWYYTTNASANFTLNFRGASGVSLDSIMAVGQSMSVVFLNTNGATPYYANAFQVDGTSVTPKWSGGSAPGAGNASAIDAYSFTIIKTAAATFTVLAGGVVKFA